MNQVDRRFYERIFPGLRNRWLNKVSRTFALSIRILPRRLRRIVGHAYILCRLLDTVEDAPELSVAEKKRSLDTAIRSIRSRKHLKTSDSHFIALSRKISLKPEEKTLLLHSHFIFECLDVFPDPVARVIENWTMEMARGMKEYAFGPDREVNQLGTLQDLDLYTYYVAGTVGKMLTGIVALELRGISRRSLRRLQDTSIDFGKGLQLVNIIKDSRKDRLENRCYIPRELLESCDLTPEEFFNPRYEEKIKGVYRHLIGKARDHLSGAHAYISALPRLCFRYRLACIWTVMLAHRTLSALSAELPAFIRGSQSFKIPRSEVRRILLGSIPAGLSNRVFFRRLRRLSPPADG